MNLAWLRPLAIKFRHTIVKNSPQILMALGTVSSINAVIFAAKAMPAAIQAKKDAEFEKSAGEELEDGRVNGVFKDDLVKLTPMELVKSCGKYYIPALGMEVFSLVCFWGAHGIDMRRQAVLAGLCSTAEAALQEYQRKVTEMLGEKGAEEVRKSIGQDRIDAAPPNTVILEGDTELWCLYDNQYFKSSYLKIKEVQNDANHQMVQHMYISKLELMWMLDPERKYLRASQNDGLIGWCLDKMIVLDVTSALGPEHKPVLLVNVVDKDGLDYAPQAGFSASL